MVAEDKKITQAGRAALWLLEKGDDPTGSKAFQEFNLMKCEKCGVDTEREQQIHGWIKKLLNKVNKVTSSHRHGLEVPKQDLTDLANRQIEFEESIWKL